MSRRKPISCCPYCGSKEGIFTKTTMVNVPYYIGFGGEEQFNGEMYDNAEAHRNGLIAYCQNCERPICRMSTLEKQWEAKEGGQHGD